MANNEPASSSNMGSQNNPINHNVELLRSLAFVGEHYNIHHLSFSEDDLNKVTVDTVVRAAQKAQNQDDDDHPSSVYPIL